MLDTNTHSPRLCNGSTADSGSACGGSNPPWGIKLILYVITLFLFSKELTVPAFWCLSKVHDLSLKDVARKKNGTDVEILVSELKRQGWIKSFVLSQTQAAEPTPRSGGGEPG